MPPSVARAPLGDVSVNLPDITNLTHYLKSPDVPSKKPANRTYSDINQLRKDIETERKHRQAFESSVVFNFKDLRKEISELKTTILNTESIHHHHPKQKQQQQQHPPSPPPVSQPRYQYQYQPQQPQPQPQSLPQHQHQHRYEPLEHLFPRKPASPSITEPPTRPPTEPLPNHAQTQRSKSSSPQPQPQPQPPQTFLPNDRFQQINDQDYSEDLLRQTYYIEELKKLEADYAHHHTLYDSMLKKYRQLHAANEPKRMESLENHLRERFEHLVKLRVRVRELHEKINVYN